MKYLNRHVFLSVCLLTLCVSASHSLYRFLSIYRSLSLLVCLLDGLVMIFKVLVLLPVAGVGPGVLGVVLVEQCLLKVVRVHLQNIGLVWLV